MAGKMTISFCDQYPVTPELYQVNDIKPGDIILLDGKRRLVESTDNSSEKSIRIKVHDNLQDIVWDPSRLVIKLGGLF